MNTNTSYFFIVKEQKMTQSSLICVYSDEELSMTAYMFEEYLNFSTGCCISEDTKYRLNNIKIMIDTIFNNQYLLIED